METQIPISPFKKYNLKKKSSTRNQNPSRYYHNNSITNLKFQPKPKYHLLKNPHIKIDLLLLLLLLLLPRDQNPLKLIYILYNESKTQYPCLLGRQRPTTNRSDTHTHTKKTLDKNPNNNSY